MTVRRNATFDKNKNDRIKQSQLLSDVLIVDIPKVYITFSFALTKA